MSDTIEKTGLCAIECILENNNLKPGRLVCAAGILGCDTVLNIRMDGSAGAYGLSTIECPKVTPFDVDNDGTITKPEATEQTRPVKADELISQLLDFKLPG